MIIVLTLLYKPLGLLIGVAGGIAANAVFARVEDARLARDPTTEDRGRGFEAGPFVS